MKTISLLAAMFLIAVFANPAKASEQIPFTGSLAAVEIDTVEFPNLFVDLSGTGNATQLGRFAMTLQAQIDLQTGMGVGTISFVAANGDSIFATETGQATDTPDPNIVSIVELATITGGTGRFAGATGTFTLERLLNLSTGISSGSFSGTISSPGVH